MNYLLNRNTRFGKKSWFRVLAPLSIILLFFALSVWRSAWVHEPLSALAAPLWRAGNALGGYAAHVAEYFRFKQTLVAEIEALRHEAAKRETVVMGYALLHEENQELKRLWGRNESEKRVLVAVLVSPPRAPYDTLVLDGGMEAGIGVGDEILFGEVVLGRVAAVTRATATAHLFSTAGVRTPAIIWRGGVTVPAEAVGEGGGAFRITVPKEAGVAVGDAVIMPGINPKQFGVIAAVETSATDSFVTAYMRSPANISSLRFLEVRSGNRSL